MKKIVLLTLLTLGLFASDDYIGIGGGYSNFNVTNQNTDLQNNGAFATLTLGHTYGDYGKFYASGSYINSSNSAVTWGVVSLAYDFMFPIVDDMFSLYVGPVAGYTAYTENSIDLSGFSFGGEAGATFNATETVQIEAGYRFLSHTVSSANITAKNMQMFYLQVNFFFNGDDYFKYE